MYKSDLENGDFIKTREGTICLIVSDGVFCLPAMEPYTHLKNYREDLTDKNDNLYDIIAVWKKENHNIDEFLDFLKNGIAGKETPEWDWERKEPKTGMVTLDNVEDGDKYWFVDFAGVICHYIYNYDDTDIEIIRNSPFGAYYTYKEMQTVYEKHVAGKKVKDIIAKYIKKHFPEGWMPDFSQDAGKYFLVWSHIGNILKVDYLSGSQILDKEFLLPHEVGEDPNFLKEVEEPFKRYLGVE